MEINAQYFNQFSDTGNDYSQVEYSNDSFSRNLFGMESLFLEPGCEDMEQIQTISESNEIEVDKKTKENVTEINIIEKQKEVKKDKDVKKISQVKKESRPIKKSVKKPVKDSNASTLNPKKRKLPVYSQMKSVISKTQKTGELFGINVERVNTHNFYYWMNILVRQDEKNIISNTCKILLFALNRNVIIGKEKENINFLLHMFHTKTKSDLSKMIETIEADSVSNLEPVHLDTSSNTKLSKFLRSFIKENEDNDILKKMEFLKTKSPIIKRKVLYYKWLHHHVPVRLKSHVEEKIGESLNEFYIDECYSHTCN